MVGLHMLRRAQLQPLRLVTSLTQVVSRQSFCLLGPSAVSQREPEETGTALYSMGTVQTAGPVGRVPGRTQRWVVSAVRSPGTLGLR